MSPSYLLDTNVCIRVVNATAPLLLNRLKREDQSSIAICSVVKAELYYGAARSNDPTKARAEQDKFLQNMHSLPFDDPAAEIAGQVRAELAQRGTPNGMNDLLIASIALAHDVALVTHNVAEFARVPGLRIEDWEAVP